MKTVVITGGCGFIGSWFIKRFWKTHPDWKIVNLDKLTYAGNRENLRELEGKERYEWVQGDICDREAVSLALRGANAVIHFAAETHVDRSIENSEDFLMTNVIGTRNMVEAAKRCNIEKFIHISSDEVYGSIAEGSVNEEAPLAPNSPYAASKAAGDLLIRSYWKTYRYPVMTIRSSNNFGPFQFPEKVIPLFITNLLDGKKVPLYGNGKNRRDWIFVDDTCRGIELIFDKGVGGEIYNIGAGNDMTNIDLTGAILKQMSLTNDRIQYVTDRLGHDFRYSVDSAKIQKLGFRPALSFAEGLQQTVTWYTENESWWRPLKRDKFTIK
ncbi:MAG: dTDP-glucose 4,6-dehydratase [Candidatus Omnitrophica bacterium]|nr:dTDP-glucose 4,6-dehydratase [Candidatus Omnitrophota bacterium]